MNLQLILGLILTIMPISELRGGLPVIIDYCLKNNLSIWPYFVIVVLLNSIIILLIFFFLDFLHDKMMIFAGYRRVIGKIIERTRKKAEKVQSKIDQLGYLALMIFVAVPLPGTGAWTGSIIAWILGLNRLKSVIAITVGVVIAGFLVLFASLGFFSLWY